jgi:acetoin utilization protein AcuB
MNATVGSLVTGIACQKGGQELTVAKWMTGDVITIHQADPVSLAFDLLLTNDIRHLPVLNRKKLVGIITDRDLHEALVPADPSRTDRSMYHTVKNIKAKDIMTPNPITIGPEAPLDQAAQIFFDRRIDCLPVKDAKGRLVGILTSTDILKAFLELREMLGGIQRIDIVMDTNEYEDVLKVLEEQKASVVSTGITPYDDLKRTVFSFRVRETDPEKLRSLLRKKGYSVLPEN